MATPLLMAILASSLSGRFYDPDSNPKRLLFTSEGTEERFGSSSHLHHVIKDTNGASVVVEDTVTQGDHFVRLQVDQLQLGSRAVVEVQRQRVRFQLTQGGKTQTREEPWSDTLVAPTSIPTYLAQRWQQILANQTLTLRLVVSERLESIAFTLRKARELNVGGIDAIAVVMRPDSLFLRAFVKPVTFVLPKKGGPLLQLFGLVASKLREGDSWKDCIAEAHFEVRP